MTEPMITLRDGTQAPLAEVMELDTQLRMLLYSAPWALTDLVAACRDAAHVVRPESASWLLDPAWGLAEGITWNGHAVISPLVRAVVLSAATGDAADVVLVEPWMPGQPGPGDLCACGIARKYHLTDRGIRPAPWTDDTCDGFTPAGGEENR